MKRQNLLHMCHEPWPIVWEKPHFVVASVMKCVQVVGMKANWMFKWNQGKHKF